MKTTDVTVEMSGEKIDAVGVQVAVKDVAGSFGDMEHIFCTGIPEANALLHDAHHRARLMVEGSPHSRIKLLLQTFLFCELLAGTPVE